MMKMLIALDEERVKSDGIYDLADMWRVIDERFKKGCTKEIQPNGSVMYTGEPSKDYFTCINLAYWNLRHSPWFAKYCTKWVWYDNDDNEELPFQDLDVLAEERKNNTLFAV